MRRPGLSKTRERIYTFIRKFYREHDYAPTVRDILKGCSLSSTAVVQHHLNALEREGRIQRDPEVFRSIRLTDKTGFSGVPLLGMIAAGEPIPVPAPDTWDVAAVSETMDVSRELTRDREGIYALRVKGMSMVDALINDGDVVLMQHVSTVDNGEMAAVWLRTEKEATLKKVYVESDRVRLQPANEQMRPLYTSLDNVEIQGRVVAVVRQIA